jgi:hypothetical protein
MCYVHWGSVSAAMLTATTLTFAAPNGEGFNNETLNDETRNSETRNSETRNSETLTSEMLTSDARSCSEIADGPRQLRVRMPEAGMDTKVLALVRKEVDAIWRQYAIDIVWEGLWTPDKPKPDLWVQFVDVALKSKRLGGAPAIAWIPFAHGMPLPFARISKPNAIALLKTRSWFDGRPLTSATEDLQRQALARIIGRALAHEIGHFLLAASAHAAHGLMRAVLDPERIVNPGTEHFKLEASDVRALRAARIASCEVALRQ